jgi:N-methylhydantoinase A
LRIVSVERGHDARECALIAFGGAGPLHAAALAEELEVAEVVVPPIPGAFSALGLVGSDIRRDYGRTFFTVLDQADPAVLEAAYGEMEVSARAMLERTGIAADNWRMERAADLRYIRQAYELTVSAPDVIDAASADILAEGFHARHELTYGHANRSERVQLVTIRLTASARLPALDLANRAGGDGSEKPSREVWFKATGRVTCGVRDRDALLEGVTLAGPVIIESLDSTIVVPPGWSLRPDDRGFIVMTRN